jgi:tRNA (adenine22-N1)-methyltransferase
MRPGEADSILIAGMGGELILHILAEGAKICEAAGELILQPQSDIRKVREYLREHSYRIIDEDMVCEDGKYYPMMRAIRVEKDEAWERMNEQTRATCDLYGPLLLRNGNPVLRRFLVREHGQLTQLLQKLAAQQESDTIRKRMSEVQNELQFNESAYTILGAIKDAGI